MVVIMCSVVERRVIFLLGRRGYRKVLKLMVNNRPLLNIEGSCIHTNLLKRIKVIPYFIYWLVLLFLS